VIRGLQIPAAFLAQIMAEARAAAPRECCGLIEGLWRGETAEALALHATENLAAGRDRFEIDPAAHIRLLRRLRGTERRIIGCYHSHPEGAALPSPRDRDGAAETDFVWLIAAPRGHTEGHINAFVFADDAFRRIDLCETLLA
jgi:proteasome lid subunit RPN8/RPN11